MGLNDAKSKGVGDERLLQTIMDLVRRGSLSTDVKTLVDGARKGDETMRQALDDVVDRYLLGDAVRTGAIITDSAEPQRLDSLPISRSPKLEAAKSGEGPIGIIYPDATQDDVDDIVNELWPESSTFIRPGASQQEIEGAISRVWPRSEPFDEAFPTEMEVDTPPRPELGIERRPNPAKPGTPSPLGGKITLDMPENMENDGSQDDVEASTMDFSSHTYILPPGLPQSQRDEIIDRIIEEWDRPDDEHPSSDEIIIPPPFSRRERRERRITPPLPSVARPQEGVADVSRTGRATVVRRRSMNTTELATLRNGVIFGAQNFVMPRVSISMPALRAKSAVR